MEVGQATALLVDGGGIDPGSAVALHLSRPDLLAFLCPGEHERLLEELDLGGHRVSALGREIDLTPIEPVATVRGVRSEPKPPMAAERILIVDHEPAVRRTLTSALVAEGYECKGAGDVRGARELLEGHDFALLICALNLPGESGMTLLESLQGSDREMAVLMATEEDDPAIAHAAAERGADGYLIKPFSRNELLIHVDAALEQARRRSQQRHLSEDSLHDAHRRAGEVRKALVEVAERERLIDEQRVEMLRRLSEVVGQRDLETGAHIRRIGRYSALLARAYGLDESLARSIGLAAPMHDVGKVAIPDAILLKHGPLSSDERSVMQRHAQIGHDILVHSGAPLLDLAAEIALTHHERFDGSGYPAGLPGGKIPISGRIVAIADVFDALLSDRPYSAHLELDEALAVMLEGRGEHFDPSLFDCFFENLSEMVQVSLSERDPST